MAASPFGRCAPWPVLLIVTGTMLVSVVRGLGEPQYGLVPALGPLDVVKFLDPVLILGVGLWALLARAQDATPLLPRWKMPWIVCTGVIAVAGIVGAVVARVPSYYAFQSVWFVLRPAIVLLVFTAFPWRRGSISLWGPVAIFASANCLVVLVQWLLAGIASANPSADTVIGLFRDAHQQATFSYTAALLGVGAIQATSRRRDRALWVIFVGANALCGFLSQGQKATGVVAVVVVLAAIVVLLRSRAWLRRAIVTAPAVLAVGVALVLLAWGPMIWNRGVLAMTGNLADRLENGGYQGLGFVRDLGVVRMMDGFWQISAREPGAVLIGLGPSNFGSPAALTRLDSGEAPEPLQRLFWWETTREQGLAETGELRLLGLSAMTSVLGVLLGEYGGPAFIAFLYLLIWPLLLRARSHRQQAGVFWLKAAYLAVVLQSILSTLGAWDNDVVLTVLMAGFASVLVPSNVPGSRENSL